MKCCPDDRSYYTIVLPAGSYYVIHSVLGVVVQMWMSWPSKIYLG